MKQENKFGDFKSIIKGIHKKMGHNVKEIFLDKRYIKVKR